MNTNEKNKIIEGSAARWKFANKDVLRQVFPLLAMGKAIPVDAVAYAVGKDQFAVEAALRAGRVGFNHAGRITELYGVTLEPTRNRADIDGVALFTCCALVAHMLPFFYQRAIRIESVDPVNNGLVRLSLSPDQEQWSNLKSAVATLPAIDKDLSTSNCAKILDFLLTGCTPYADSPD